MSVAMFQQNLKNKQEADWIWTAGNVCRCLPVLDREPLKTSLKKKKKKPTCDIHDDYSYNAMWYIWKFVKTVDPKSSQQKKPFF